MNQQPDIRVIDAAIFMDGRFIREFGTTDQAERVALQMQSEGRANRFGGDPLCDTCLGKGRINVPRAGHPIWLEGCPDCGEDA